MYKYFLVTVYHETIPRYDSFIYTFDFNILENDESLIRANEILKNNRFKYDNYRKSLINVVEIK